eukprot:TRINITY_DN17477_c0_g1_i7.p1 TRINITY_DN17477_c0_g1~~TRINITY_DN17477_c0_g1_i7.p1  ORF type:complete len:116 (-),score=10.27 TRINITY_DN17477_c0_g1_i7:10-357(-)
MESQDKLNMSLEDIVKSSGKGRRERKTDSSFGKSRDSRSRRTEKRTTPYQTSSTRRKETGPHESRVPETPLPNGLKVSKTSNVKIVAGSIAHTSREIGRAVQQECRDRSRMPSSA